MAKIMNIGNDKVIDNNKVINKNIKNLSSSINLAKLDFVNSKKLYFAKINFFKTDFLT